MAQTTLWYKNDVGAYYDLLDVFDVMAHMTLWYTDDVSGYYDLLVFDIMTQTL